MLQREFVLESILSLLAALRVFFRSRSDTALEVLARTSLGQNALTRCHDLSWLILVVQSTGYN